MIKMNNMRFNSAEVGRQLRLINFAPAVIRKIKAVYIELEV